MYFVLVRSFVHSFVHIVHSFFSLILYSFVVGFLLFVCAFFLSLFSAFVAFLFLVIVIIMLAICLRLHLTLTFIFITFNYNGLSKIDTAVVVRKSHPEILLLALFFWVGIWTRRSEYGTWVKNGIQNEYQKIPKCKRHERTEVNRMKFIVITISGYFFTNANSLHSTRKYEINHSIRHKNYRTKKTALLTIKVKTHTHYKWQMQGVFTAVCWLVKECEE